MCGGIARARQQVGAEVGEQPAAQGEDPAVGVQRELDRRRAARGPAARRAKFSQPVLGPLDRPARARSAASATSGVSTGSVPLEPKPPPTSGTITRIADSARPSICASCARGRCALCDDDQTVRRSPPARRSPRAAPSATPTSRGITWSVRTTCAAAANAPATSPARFSQRASVSVAARGSTTASQRLVVDLDALGGVLGQRARLAHHGGDRLADVADLVARPAADAARGATVSPGGGSICARRRRARRSAAVEQRAAHRRAPGRGRAG